MDEGFYAVTFWQELAHMRAALGVMKGVNGMQGLAFREGVYELVSRAREDVGLNGLERNERLEERFEEYSHGNSREGVVSENLRNVGKGLYGAIMALCDCHPSPFVLGKSHISWDRKVAQETIAKILKNGLS